MDILKPPLLWIEGRCYRINPEDNINESKPRGDEWDETPEKYGIFHYFMFVLLKE